MKLMTVIGARPQFVKAAVVSRALELAGIEEVLVHTGQHFDKNMSDVFFDELGMSRPVYNLGIGGGSHGENTGRMIEAIEKLLVQLRRMECWCLVIRTRRWPQLWLQLRFIVPLLILKRDCVRLIEGCPRKLIGS